MQHLQLKLHAHQQVLDTMCPVQQLALKQHVLWEKQILQQVLLYQQTALIALQVGIIVLQDNKFAFKQVQDGMQLGQAGATKTHAMREDTIIY